MTIPIRGRAALVVAAVIIAVTLIWLPAYRWVFLISFGIGVVIAAVLYLWHKFRPVRDEDVENKRPLGLS
jgi:TM2 domain-containing membrane protein YozV